MVPSHKRSLQRQIVQHGGDGNVVELRLATSAKGRFEALSAEKLRGGYYTPPSVAAWMCQWAIQGQSDTVLEPSCGDGVFLDAAARRLLQLGAPANVVSSQLRGVELLPGEAATARGRLEQVVGIGARDIVASGDFFGWWDRKNPGRFSAVIGNPPFIRYQSFPEPARGRAMAIMQSVGMKPNRLTNIWVPFVVAAAELLEPGGRMALVIPAELLQVTYAAQLRTFLTERFSHLDIVTCNELFFEDAEQEVVLLLASGARSANTESNACRVAVSEARSLADLMVSSPANLLAGAEEKDVRGGREKWLKYFLSGREIGLMRELRMHSRIVEVGQLAEVDVGIVTGANDFFVLRGGDIGRRGLSATVHPIVSRSAHMRGAILTQSDWNTLAERDERVHLVNIRANKRGGVPVRAASYVAEGEAAGIHRGYKCSIRTPWFHVPALWTPDAFLFRQIHDFPRFVLNQAGAASTDTIHRVRVRGCAPEILVAGAFTHLTAASAEIEGRSYGGGVLELEPNEAELLLIPDATAMTAAMPLEECDKMVRAGRLGAALEENDRLVLSGAMGVSAADCASLSTVWSKMRERRFARGKRARRSS
jgi:adenine-specific DNA methylase